MLEAYETFLKLVTSTAKWLMLALTAAIFAIICFAVFSRYVLNYVPSWSEEVPRYLLVWITYLGAALAVNYQEHISLDVLFNLMPDRARLQARLILNALIGLVGLIMFVFGIGLVRAFGDDLMESIAVPNLLLYLAMPVSGALIMLYVVRMEIRIVRTLRGGGSDDPSAKEIVPVQSRRPKPEIAERAIMALLIAFFCFFFLLIINLPISFGIGLGAMLAGLTLDIDNATIIQRMVSAVNSFPLLAVIFFIFAGTLMARGGVSTRLVRLAEVLVGRVPGALAHVTILACMFFGGVSGSAVAEVSSIGSMMIPTMHKAGYRKETATAIALASAVMGPIIPPSIPMIIFAHAAGSVSIAALFLAGAIPGICIGLSLMIWAFFHARKHVPPVQAVELPLREKVRRVADGLAGLFTLVIILGGILSGLFTATEAGAVASLYALFLCVFVYGEVRVRDLPKILFESCQVNAVVLFLVATSSAFTWILTFENLPRALAETVFAITDNKILLLLIINLILLVIGCLIDLTPAIIMLAPILLPLMQKMDVNIVQFGAMMVVNLCYGLITPPVGTSLFVGIRIANVPMTALVRPLLPLLAIDLVILVAITYWPPFTLWLPRLLGFL